MKTYTRDAVNEIYLMLNEPRAYAAQALQDMRDVMHVSVEEGPQFFSGFHEAAVQAKAELNRKRAEAYRDCTIDLTPKRKRMQRWLFLARLKARALVAGYEEQASQIPPATARYVEKKYCRTREYPNGAGVVLGVGISLMFWGFCMAVYYFGPMIWRVL